ncbi:hypothetical protein NQ318_022195 [Aromia moschata]|uniref:Calponin-homology (CH) domain-containing protein n=1 Tax=Aromia moschata TaxID=1265417 RepID=A0AAV8Z8A8_9CUCU|nr:hypothetical protein NQ318_022195 [Aromia moschata]
MENLTWEDILVDWVNCLKLSKPIQKLDDLKDGLFLSNLQKVIKKSSEIESDVLTCLFEILNQYYPNFIINNKAYVHLSDLPLNDVSLITSLLLHYTCIHDRRDVLTSPLCHNLKQNTQKCIRTFLEKIQEAKKLGNGELINIIESCIKEVNKKTEACQWLSMTGSPISKESPLQDILQTPTIKENRLLRKDKEITRLKTELELAQEEKESAEEDLKLQIEKNKKLESLEQIVEQCDKENRELEEERDAEKVQVKTLESQCKMWLEKFIETDGKLQYLTDISKQQEIKYESLQNHCAELEALLDELKPKSHNESYTEESFQIPTNINRRSRNFERYSCEDLAHSVVDVQLKEVQKENEGLKMVLTKKEEEANQLKDDMFRISEQSDEIRKKLEENKKQTSEMISKLTEEKNMLNEKLSAIEEEKNVVSKFLDLNNEELQKVIQEKEVILEALEMSNKEVGKVIREKQEVTEQLMQEKNWCNRATYESL